MVRKIRDYEYVIHKHEAWKRALEKPAKNVPYMDKMFGRWESHKQDKFDQQEIIRKMKLRESKNFEPDFFRIQGQGEEGEKAENDAYHQDR